MKNKIIFITLFIMMGLLAVVWLAGCSEKIVNENNGRAGLALEPNFTVKGNLEAVSIFRVRVEAEDIPVPIVVEMQMVNGLLVADVPIPAGRKRKITVEALDNELNVIYRGVRILDIYPSDVELPVISIDLMPTVPIIKVTPHYTRQPLGLPLTCEVEVFSIPNLYGLTFVLSQNGQVTFLDSVTRGTSLTMDDNFSTSIYWTDIGQEAYVTAVASDNLNVLVDGTGYANLARFYFRSYVLPDEDIDNIDLILQLNVISANVDGVIDTIPRAGIFVDQGRMELPRKTWELSYGGLNSDIGNDIVQTPDGNFVVVGSTTSFGAAGSDLYFMRIDSLGNFIGDKTFGGTGYDYANAVINTRDGGLAIIGQVDVGTVTSDYDALFIKTDLFGNVKSEKYYGTTLNESANDIKQTSDGGYIISGHKEDSLYLIKTDAQGNIVWDEAYADTVTSHVGHIGNSVIQTSDGGYLVAGEVWFPNESRAGYLLKANAQGVFVWDLVFLGTLNCSFNSIDKTGDGNYILTGDYDYDVYLVKINSSGGVVWEKFYGDAGDDRGYSVVTCPDGGFFVTGYFYDGLYDKVDEMYLIKTNPAGEIVWDTTYGEYNSDIGYSGIPTSDGGYIACGYIYSFNNSYDILIVKTDANGKTYFIEGFK